MFCFAVKFVSLHKNIMVYIVELILVVYTLM